MSEYLKTQVRSHEPYTFNKSGKEQQLIKRCPECGAELFMFREPYHQHWRPSGRECPSLVEWNYVVYIQCGICGGLSKTRLKPMAKSMPKDLAKERGLIP